MDKPRPTRTGKHHARRTLLLGGGLLAGIAFFLWTTQLKSASLTIDKNSVWVDTVKKGSFLREVRGPGTLVSEEISWIGARNDGRIEKILVWPGTRVEPETVIVTMNNPELQQAVLDSDAAVTAVEAKRVNTRAQLQSQSLERQAALIKAEGEKETSAAELEVDQRLSKNGLIAAVDLKKSEITAHQFQAMYEIERQRFEFVEESIGPQLEVAEGEIRQLKAQSNLRHSQLDSLQVRAGMTGVLQQITIEIGQRIVAGTNVAKVADLTHLKAQIKIAETQAKDVAIGQAALIDSRTGDPISGHVSRIDPAVQQGTVLVEISFAGSELPRGVRPDLSVEGSIELENLRNVVFVGRPAFAQDEGLLTLFKLNPNGKDATRTKVLFGRGSINAIEIREGLRPGDSVILSDMNAYENQDRITLQ